MGEEEIPGYGNVSDALLGGGFAGVGGMGFGDAEEGGGEAEEEESVVG